MSHTPSAFHLSQVRPRSLQGISVNPADGSRQFPEALRVIKQGLTTEELTFNGDFIISKKCRWF
jgi:hypothetical protein